MRPRSAMFPHQQQASTLMVERKQMAALMPMGTGKTVTTLTALVDIAVLRSKASDQPMRRALVVAPARVVEMDVWGREAAQWEHLQGVDVLPIEGTAKQRLKNLLGSTDPSRLRIDTVSYENVVWLAEQVYLPDTYDAIVFDELSRVKHPGTKKFRKLRSFSMPIPVRFGLTGSPVGNALSDIWGEMFMVAGEKPLGPRVVDFRQQYFTEMRCGSNAAATTLVPREGAAEEIHRRIAPWSFSLDKNLVAGQLPELRVNVLEVALPPKVRELEAKLATEAHVMLESGTDLKALSASALAAKVRQLASGAVYTTPPPADGGIPIDKLTWEEVHTCKLDLVKELLQEMQGEPVLLFYWYQHEIERLERAFPQARRVSPAALDAWDRREVPLLIAHPASAGHGLNLQAGGFNIVWFTLPWSHELWEQANARLARTGQRSPFVTAHVLCAGEADRAVLEVLREKGKTQAALMQSVRLPVHVDISDL